MATATAPTTSPAMQQCIENCTRCHQVCVQTFMHCLREGGHHAQPDHQRLMQDCAQICATSADFMLRGSPLHKQTCRACAAVCAECARDCRAMADGDEPMRACADACERCAKSCEQMAA